MPTDDRLLVLPTEESWVYFWLPLIFLIWQEILARNDGASTAASENS
jgi:hypothetical protein